MVGVAGSLQFGVPLDRAKVLCAFVHGRGQTPEDMVDTVLQHLTTGDVAYCLPRAEGKSWYAAKAVDPLTEITRQELAKSLSELASFLAEFHSKAKGRPLVLAGFSQGACLAIECLTSAEPPVDAVVAFTGCRVGRTGEKRSPVTCQGLPVYLSAGDKDPWIPVDAFAETVAELGRAGAALRCDVFPDRPHEVSAAEIQFLDTVLSDFAAGRPITLGAPR